MKHNFGSFKIGPSQSNSRSPHKSAVDNKQVKPRVLTGAKLGAPRKELGGVPGTENRKKTVRAVFDAYRKEYQIDSDDEEKNIQQLAAAMLAWVNNKYWLSAHKHNRLFLKHESKRFLLKGRAFKRCSTCYNRERVDRAHAKYQLCCPYHEGHKQWQLANRKLREVVALDEYDQDE